jgi:hypothetical protein
MVRQVIAGWRARKRLTSLLALTVIFALSGSAVASASVKFVSGPGTGKPPGKLKGLKMHKFKKDHRKKGGEVTAVPGPTGSVKFSSPVFHDIVKNLNKPGYWKTWSNGYHGDVYFIDGSTLTMTLPPKTKAFYFYAEPNVHNFFKVTASSGGASSGPVQVHGNAGAKFFGFVAKGGDLTSITVTSTAFGFAVGEFGIHKG